MNEVPRAEEMNEGILRRLAFVPFRHKFTGDELDPGIRKKMSSQQNLSRLALLGATAARKMIEEGREVFSRIDGMEPRDRGHTPGIGFRVHVAGRRGAE